MQRLPTNLCSLVAESVFEKARGRGANTWLRGIGSGKYMYAALFSLGSLHCLQCIPPFCLKLPISPLYRFCRSQHAIRVDRSVDDLSLSTFLKRQVFRTGREPTDMAASPLYQNGLLITRNPPTSSANAYQIILHGPDAGNHEYLGSIGIYSTNKSDDRSPPNFQQASCFE